MIKPIRTLLRTLWLLLALAVAAVTSSPTTAHAQGEQIVVIQKKPFSKKYRLEISLFAGVVPSNPFLTYIPLEGRLGFHLSEGFAIEAAGGYSPPLGAGTIKNQIHEDLKGFPHFLGVRIFEQQVFYANLDLVWTPIHGKLRVAALQWIAYWEILVQIGGGVTGVYDFERSGRFDSDNTNPIKMRPTLNLGAGTRLWLTRWLTLRLDIRMNLFQKQIGKGGLSQHLSIVAGLSFVLP